MKTLVACALLSFCVGCAPTTTIHTISAPFDKPQAERLLAAGRNSIRGSARINFHEGGAATCHGGQVVLLPATQYARERMESLFGDNEILFLPSSSVSSYNRFEPDDPDFSLLRKLSICDSNGNFEFLQLADGDFIVLTTISWMVGAGVNSASFMRQVTLENGTSKSVEFVHEMYRTPFEPRWIER